MQNRLRLFVKTARYTLFNKVVSGLKQFLIFCNASEKLLGKIKSGYNKFEKKDIAIYVSGGGSSAGVKSIINGVSDSGMASRKVTDEEKAKIEGYQEFKLGMDALTISVNPKNNLTQLKDSLTTEVIKKIFAGEYKTWNDVDASLPKTEIVVVTRDIADQDV